jgi:hypothetical protein
MLRVVRRVRTAVFVTLLFGAAGACTSPHSASPKLSDYLHLDKTRVVAGQSFNGDLVVYNPGDTINLSEGCLPELAVQLDRGSFHQALPFSTAICAGGPLLVHHGTTKLPVNVDTTYNICSQSPPYSVTLPKCVGSNPPPLPVGTYMVKAVWDEKVPLPTAKGVALTLVG